MLDTKNSRSLSIKNVNLTMWKSRPVKRSLSTVLN